MATLDVNRDIEALTERAAVRLAAHYDAMNHQTRVDLIVDGVTAVE